jgi:hypothetical protein
MSGPAGRGRDVSSLHDEVWVWRFRGRRSLRGSRGCTLEMIAVGSADLRIAPVCPSGNLTF